MSRYIKKTEEEKQYNRMIGQVRGRITKRLNKPMPKGIYKKENEDEKISQEASRN